MNDLLPLAAIAGTMAASALLTALFGLVAGRPLARISRPWAALATAVLVPGSMLAASIVRLRIESAAHPTGDGPVMAFTGALMFCAIALLASLPVAGRVLPSARRPDADGQSEERP